MSLSAPLLVQSLHDSKEAIRVGRQLLTNLQEQQWLRFESKAPIQHLISERTNFIDQLLRRVWKHHIGATQRLCLVAVGGYGRGELHPFSDIDILILIPETRVNAEEQRQLEVFITYLWDIGLQVGHAIRSLTDCYEMGKSDLSTATNYIEARWLIGFYEDFDQLRQLWRKRDFWPSREFFKAKVDEQIARHNKAHDVLAQLEPNIKESPGGLRDIHTLAWVAKRHFDANSLQQLVSVGFLSVNEYNDLERAMRFHWRVRFVLHHLTQRKEERLLFEHQKRIAEQLGYREIDGKLAVENFMQDYYRNAKTIQRLNALLLQHFREDIFASPKPNIQTLNEHFSLIDKSLNVNSEQVFIHHPIQLLHCFVWLTDPRVESIRAQTQRIIQNYAHLVNETFCQQAQTWQVFRHLLQRRQGVTRSLRSMHALGLLGRLLPAFHRITGLMQFDLFHAYTVDEHTLFVVRNLRGFLRRTPEAQEAYPLACDLAQQIGQADILLLAGLFHDIAKGRGGDHALLGAEDARAFAQQAQLSEHETHLLSWLVETHLLMSHTAQKKDISEPEVIERFCQLVVTPERLNYLYLLTVADICATSPVVWNGWKDNLLKTLYHRAKHYFEKQPQHDDRQRATLAHFNDEEQQRLTQFWTSLANTQYQQQQSADDLLRHAHVWLDGLQPLPIASLAASEVKGVTSLLIFADDHPGAWLILTAAFDQAKFNIVDAKLYTNNQHQALIELKFLSPKHWSHNEQQDWLSQLLDNLRQHHFPKTPFFQKPNSRQQQFSIKTQAVIQQQSHHSEVSLMSRDRPGLLYRCALVFHELGFNLISARISTAGLRVEDVFLMRNQSGEALTQDEAKTLALRLEQVLN
ncbi:MAG: [protein-PII] uridylyltransferase [Gammaproteobacteria bacterium]|nr:[protein-PII] uridylyltransferase [Gammaproteobacteria bacterium]